MKNLIVRSITGVIFVAAVVTCFLRPEAMILLFALVTGLTVWEYTGIVNNIENVTVNRFLATVAGVYLFFGIAGFCSGIVPSAVFIPYLLTVVYMFISELADVHRPTPLDAQRTGIQRHSRRSGILIAATAERVHIPLDQRHGCLSERFALRQAQAVSTGVAWQELGRKHRRRYSGDSSCSLDRHV